MSSTDHKATHIVALLNAAGIGAVVVGPNEVATDDIDRARELIGSRTDCEHDELGIKDREGSHIALVPVTELPRR